MRESEAKLIRAYILQKNEMKLVLQDVEKELDEWENTSYFDGGRIELNGRLLTAEETAKYEKEQAKEEILLRIQSLEVEIYKREKMREELLSSWAPDEEEYKDICYIGADLDGMSCKRIREHFNSPNLRPDKKTITAIMQSRLHI